MEDDRTVVEELAGTWAAIDAVLEGLAPSQWELGTDCPGWTVRDHVSHLIGTESLLLGRPVPHAAPDGSEAFGPHVRNDIGRMNEPWVAERRGRAADAVLAEFREVTTERLAALRAMGRDDFAADSWTPTGPGTYGGFMGVRAFDSWVHEQDIRQAVGLPWRWETPGAGRAMDTVQAAMGYVVGKRAGAPEGTTVAFVIEGPVGRRFAVEVSGGRARPLEELPDDPTVRISSDVETFLGLGFGRAVPATALASGGITVEGDEELGRRIVDHLGVIL